MQFDEGALGKERVREHVVAANAEVFTEIFRMPILSSALHYTEISKILETPTRRAVRRRSVNMSPTAPLNQCLPLSISSMMSIWPISVMPDAFIRALRSGESRNAWTFSALFLQRNHCHSVRIIHVTEHLEKALAGRLSLLFACVISFLPSLVVLYLESLHVNV